MDKNCLALMSVHVCQLIQNVYYYYMTVHKLLPNKFEDTNRGNQDPEDRQYNGQ